MREITTHKGNELDDALTIKVLDKPGHGGACHQYAIEGAGGVHIYFQEGPVKEHGVNGISIESLLAICIDRLEGFQSGPHRCRENALAVTKLEEAMHWLQHRTRARQARGVEGTSAQ